MSWRGSSDNGARNRFPRNDQVGSRFGETSARDDWGSGTSRPSNDWGQPSSKKVFYENAGSNSSNGSSRTIPVPSRDLGKIIGRGGSKIKQLEEESGARVKVIKDENGGENSRVQISGSDAAQQKAEELISKLLDSGFQSNSFSSFGDSGFSSRGSQPKPSDEAVMVDWGAVIQNSIEETKKKWAQAAPIEKNFYIEDPDVKMMLTSEVEAYRLSHNNIMVSHYSKEDTRSIPNPVLRFDQAFGHYPELLEAVSSQGFSEPSPIQSQSWPILLKGYDMIGIAQTGTGKTLAFLLPAMVHIQGQPTPRDQRDGPTILVMAPTRELAQQIEREVKKFPYKGIKCVCVYGGGSRKEQMSSVAKGVEIVVATPGRLYDLMQAGALKTSSVSYVVLDEADRMLDLGFEPQIKKILIEIRPDRQMVMTSATWPEGVRRIAKEYMDSPLQVYVGTLDLAAVHSVSQRVEILAEEDKRQRLMDYIASMQPDDKAIVFVGRKIVADQLASDLTLSNISCQCIHGDRDQMDREQALDDLRSGEVRLLIATDVASRGIDIKDITHILNFDFPRHAEEYVHRVGRTGRAGRTGQALSFMTREDWSKAPDLINILEEANQEVPEELRQMADRYAAWKVRKDEEKLRNNIDSGRGGGGGRGCFNCGQEGHFSRECPNGGSGGRGGGGGRGGRGGRGGGRRDDFSSNFY